jgi:hypothetical protein
MRRLIREPLVHFLLVGVLLFLASEQLAGPDPQVIAVTGAERTRLADQWQAQRGRPPTEAEMNGLVEQWLREEIHYREALAMGLDADDVIIRRRLAQKLRFLTEDLGTQEPPDEAEVRTYFERHADRYAEPERFSFQQVFFSRERRPDARADAADTLLALEGDVSPRGDASVFRHSYTEQTGSRIADDFGKTFSTALEELEVGAGWQGPVPSTYGWHLVRLNAHQPSRTPQLQEVAVRVAEDLREERRRRAREAYYQSLRDRYRVVRQ